MNEDTIELNAEQQAVVDHGEGPLLVVAGAGTGKTRVITERIKRLVSEEEVLPHEILALTFTEKSAREMEERVDRALPYGAVDTWIMTFHGFCERVLREHAISIGLDPAYTIMNEAQSRSLLAELLPDLSLSYFMPLGNPTSFVGGLLTHFNRVRDEDIAPEEYASFADTFMSDAETKEEQEEESERYAELSRVYTRYQEEKAARSLVDYADLIASTLRLFRNRPSVLRAYQEQFRFILVDEFQDTNYAQTVLLKMLAGDDHNIMVVGDDDQSIFRWRGAAVYNVLDFEKHYPTANTVTLVKNYRSAQPILDRAYDLIQHNNPDRLEEKLQIDKQLQSQVGGEATIEAHTYDHGSDEAAWVADEIVRLLKEGEYTPQDIALLVRANNHADPFVQELAQRGIPYAMSGGEGWYYHPAVKDLLAYMRVLTDLGDSVSWYRLLTIPEFGIDGVDVARLTAAAKGENKTLHAVLERVSEIEEVSEETKKQVEKLITLVHEHLRTPRESVGRLLYSFMERVGLVAVFKEAESDEELRSAAEVARLFEEIQRFEVSATDHSARAFVSYMDMLLAMRASSSSEDMETDAVQVVTVHSAKGLEFPVVFMVNLVAGRFPSINRRDPIPLPEALVKETPPSSLTAVHTQEERRLFYVGMTRAQERLYLTAASLYGQGVRPRKPSPFIAEALGDDALTDPPPRSTSSSRKGSVEIASTQSNHLQKVETVSYSQLDTFTVCPLQYKYSYVLRLPGEKSAAASYGSALHDALRDFYTALRTGERWGVDELVARYHALWRSQGFTDQRIEELRKKEGEDALRQYVADHHDPAHLPAHIEKPFSITIGEVRLKGVVDRIDVHEDGSVEVIDYKTSKPLSERQLKKNMQLSLYALAVTSPQFLDIPLEKLTLTFYNFADHTKRSTTRTAEELEEAKQYVLDQVAEIEQSSFPPKVSRLCEYCSYQMLCDAYQGSLRKKP